MIARNSDKLLFIRLVPLVTDHGLRPTWGFSLPCTQDPKKFAIVERYENQQGEAASVRSERVPYC